MCRVCWSCFDCGVLVKTAVDGTTRPWKFSSEEVTATNTHKPTLQIRPHMSLEEAMAAVRRYLDAQAPTPRGASVRREPAAAPGQPRPFALLGSSIGRLSQVAAKCGEIEP